jgi:hypothetical protein
LAATAGERQPPRRHPLLKERCRRDVKVARFGEDALVADDLLDDKFSRMSHLEVILV